MFEQVKEFHEKFEIPVNEEINSESLELRNKLIFEEAHEVSDEFFPVIKESGQWIELPVDKSKLTKELADLLYVTLGTAVQFGLPIEEVFSAVHKSNMSKLGEDGKPIRRGDGKVLKGPNYKEPDLKEYFQ